MKIFVRVVFVLFVLVAVLVAVSNSQPVQLTLWPLPHLIVMPLYLLIVALLLLGLLMGLGLGWWNGRHHRRRAREQGSEAARLEREVAHLREAAAGDRPSAPMGSAAQRDQKATERQRALVAPDLLPPTARNSSA
jgi:uncharacterized integral membrane protein